MKSIFLVPIILTVVGRLAAAPLESRFSAPPSENRILKIIHNWPDAPAAQDSLISTLTGQGFGGVVSNVSFTDYMVSEGKWDAFLRAVAEAKRAGFSMWLYDEKGYPSGTAGGLVLEGQPEWEARGLLIADRYVAGGSFSMDLPPGQPLMAAAYPVGRDGLVRASGRVDLAAAIADGRLVWDAPATGNWWVVAISEDFIYEGTHAANSLAEKLPCTNLLMAEPTARFIEITHAEYVRRMGADLGEWFEAAFTDEPSLMSVFLRPMPYRVLPWAPDFAAEFEQRRGYALLEELPALIAEFGPASAKVRHDFWLTVGELVSRRYFGQIDDYCREHNLLSGGHLIWEEDLRYHVGFYGDFFRCLREMSSPGIDCLTSIPAAVPWTIARLIGSAADLDGKVVTMSETSDHVQYYRSVGDTRPREHVSEGDICGICNRLLLGGINQITSYYSFAGLDRDALRRLNDWVGRCSVLLTGARQVPEIAVLYPVESLWTRFTPARHGATDSVAADKVRQVFDAVSTSLYSARRDFTFVDARTIQEGRVEDGAFVHGDFRWRVIVLPVVDTLPLEAWEKLAAFEESGGVLVAIGGRPTNSAEEFPAAAVQAMGARMLPAEERPAVKRAGLGTGVYLPETACGLLTPLLDAILEPELVVDAGGSALSIRLTHRRMGDEELFFLINDSGDGVRVQFSLAAAGAGRRWDPADGTVTAVASANGLTEELPPYGGVFYSFPRAVPRRLLHPEPGLLPGMTVRALPAVTPTEGHGADVAAVLEAIEPEPGEAAGAAWRAHASILKSDVDTHMFVAFPFAEPLEMTDVEGLFLDAYVPVGQRTRAQLLMILRERDGSDYLASTGRSLASAGWGQIYVPLGNFQLQGWSADENGRLDLDEITQVSIGWGGYFGEAGETIEFRCRPPELALRQVLQASSAP